MPVKATPLFCGLVKLTANLLKVAGDTVTDKRSEPVDEIVPSVADTVDDSALYNTIVPLATPFINVKLVAVPKSVAPTVGTVAGLLEVLAPENVMSLAPVYVVAVLPFASFAVTVTVWLPPAV